MSSQVRSRTLWSNPHDLSDTAAYGPSFVDRFMGLIQRLPVPYWLTLLVLFALQSALVHALAWIDGWLAAYTFSPLLLLFPGWLWGPIGIMIYLNSTSREAVSSFRPLLDIDDERLTRLKREFTTMPARSVVLSSILWSILYAILWVVSYDTVSVAYGIGPLLTAALIVEGLVSFSIGGAIYYHSLRQLRLVNRTVQMVERVNLFELVVGEIDLLFGDLEDERGFGERVYDIYREARSTADVDRGFDQLGVALGDARERMRRVHAASEALFGDDLEV